VHYKEWGLPEKQEEAGQIRVAHVYPGSYKEAMASLGYLTIFSRLNEEEDIIAHRFTLDSPFSIEAGLPLRAYDVIVASIHFDLQIPAFLKYLATQKIPLRKEEREQPVIVGGPATWNPLPLVPIVDAVSVGEGEDTIANTVRGVAESKQEYTDKNTFNTWVKNRAEFARHDLSYRPPAIVAEESAYGRRAIYVEPSRGCNFGCRFCLIGWTKRPRRDRKLSQILEWIEEGLENNGEKVYFYASDILGHPYIKKVLEILGELRIPASLSSLRFDRLDDEMLNVLRSVGTRTITVAPEVASTTLKARINKPIPNEGIVELARRAKKKGIRRMKLYFLFGIPGETEEDVRAIIDLVKTVKKEGVDVKASVNPMIPKAHTPMQWAPFAGIEYIQRWNKVFEKEIHANTMNPKRAFIQTLLSIGDEKVGEVLLHAYKDVNYSHWMEAIQAVSLDLSHYMEENRETPWREYIDTGVRDDFLQKEWEKAWKGEYTPPCHERCSLCGVCFP
jgi:radical SAM superfamily enzyme YgiQ (UPF0313 family)